MDPDMALSNSLGPVVTVAPGGSEGHSNQHGPWGGMTLVHQYDLSAHEENILKGVRDFSYSLESSIELLQKDVVQLHAPRYQSMRRDVIGCTQEMDFILWPWNDIEKTVCLLFSRWKECDEPFRPVQAKFEFHHGDYEKQFLHVLSCKDKTGTVVNNPNQSVFLFIDRQHLQTPKKKKATIFKLCSICLYLPQEQPTHWAVGTIEDHLHPYMPE
ncbi:LOW QUALITY PROTEIN: uncharacterized protein C6orf62 homolog [Arvicola amphibius]|uniref:LOW QUALITY PROTEIN: uncharacterized protein C6orf62 homolog n=1 Tax=Arvicola amphibius TaxID=1047088 RepID=UPI0018E3BC4C|nr:LOW QUALITY PROTEIN: uncharacterized protein C6orf62 homolog [Arvicola amphibius]